MLAGSPGYQSPEQLRSESCVIPSDVYAFGALTVVVLKESALWPGLNFFQIMQKVTNNEHPSVDALMDLLKVLRPYVSVASVKLLQGRTLSKYSNVSKKLFATHS